MAARNARVSANPRYACDREFQEFGRPRCQSVVAASPDRLIESLVLTAVEPASLELSPRVPELASRLGVKPIEAHRWRWSGWLHARQLRGKNGRCVVWANAAELTRLGRLRAFEVRHKGRRTPPANLTTPARRKRSDRSTTHSQNGGD
jgi:hypothetical protein